MYPRPNPDRTTRGAELVGAALIGLGLLGVASWGFTVWQQENRLSDGFGGSGVTGGFDAAVPTLSDRLEIASSLSFVLMMALLVVGFGMALRLAGAHLTAWSRRNRQPAPRFDDDDLVTEVQLDVNDSKWAGVPERGDDELLRP